jgi:hypothetical protein
MIHHANLVTAYIGTGVTAPLVRQFLLDNGIQATLEDEYQNTVDDTWVSPGSKSKIKVLVYEDELNFAINHLKEFFDRQMSK